MYCKITYESCTVVVMLSHADAQNVIVQKVAVLGRHNVVLPEADLKLCKSIHDNVSVFSL